MEIIAISLKSDEARRERLANSLAPYGLRFHWLEGVDARAWTGQEARRHMDEKSVFRTMSHDPNPGAIGCHLSHMKAFDYLLESDHQALLILEDDAQITDAFAEYLRCIETAMSSLDIVFLHDFRPNRPSKLIGTSAKGLEFRFKRFSNIGTVGYVINRKAAALMLAHHKTFGREIDMLLNRWWQTGLHVATTGIDLVYHDFMGSHIGHDEAKHKPRPLRYVASKLYRAYSSVEKRRKYNAHATLMKTAFEKGRSQ